MEWPGYGGGETGWFCAFHGWTPLLTVKVLEAHEVPELYAGCPELAVYFPVEQTPL